MKVFGVYKILYRRPVEKELRLIPVVLRRKIVKKILQLSKNPYMSGATKLQGNPDRYRIRQGDYRIIYEIMNTELVILVIKVGHRKDVYKKLL